jgi:hypothetical protein
MIFYDKRISGQAKNLLLDNEPIIKQITIFALAPWVKHTAHQHVPAIAIIQQKK